MKIGDLAQHTGVSPRLLRYYEQQGLLRPDRTSSGYRSYRSGDVSTVRRIRQLLAAGLSTQTINSVLPCLRDDRDGLVPTCPNLLADLRAEHRRIERAIDNLIASRDTLRDVITAADRELPSSHTPNH